jgi:hypothetical protein
VSNEITRYQPGNVDISRRGGQLGNDAGGSGGGHGDAHDTPEVARLRGEIAKITRLAHTGKEKDERAYVARQGELRNLMAQLVAAQGGGAVAPTADVPSRPEGYPNLPTDSVYREAWADARPALQDAGISQEQARLLGQAVLRAEQEGQQRAAAAASGASSTRRRTCTTSRAPP